MVFPNDRNVAIPLLPQYIGRNFKIGPDGTLWAATYWNGLNPKNGAFSPYADTFVLNSTDNGHSWTLQGHLPYIPDNNEYEYAFMAGGYDEPALEFMPDGSVPLPNLMANVGTQPFPVGLLIAVIALVLMSGFFSSTETAYSCSNRIKLRSLASNGNNRAKKVLDLAENKYDKLISTILIGNNIVNLSASTLSTLLFAKLIVDANTSALVSTVVITLAVLIFGEITPKFIARVYPEKLAMAFYPIINFLYYVFYIFNFIINCYIISV